MLSIIQTAAGKLLSDVESSEEFDYIERAMILSLKACPAQLFPCFLLLRI